MSKTDEFRHCEEEFGINVTYGVEEFTETLKADLKANCKDLIPIAQSDTIIRNNVLYAFPENCDLTFPFEHEGLKYELEFKIHERHVSLFDFGHNTTDVMKGQAGITYWPEIYVNKDGKKVKMPSSGIYV
jgi:hypothetical protein